MPVHMKRHLTNHTKPLYAPQRLDPWGTDSSWLSPAFHPFPRKKICLHPSDSKRHTEISQMFYLCELILKEPWTCKNIFVWGCSWRRGYTGLDIDIPPIVNQPRVQDQAPIVVYTTISWASLLVHPPADITGHQLPSTCSTLLSREASGSSTWPQT